ncbi:MAG: hypothetical protein JWM59_1552 [Verrucomicrobiales bacterium]|nr:hypothetical protein [Verrucomicrobiales bacterium]
MALLDLFRKKSKSAGFVQPARQTWVKTLSATDAIVQAGSWRDNYNPLRGLTPWYVTGMVEAAQRGAQTEFQWLLKWIRDEDAVVAALVERSLSALSALEWDVLIPEHLEGEQKTLAEAQQKALKEFYTSLKGLRESIEAIGLARFTGCAFLEKVVTPTGPQLSPVPSWYFVRNGSRGAWAYNPTLSMGATTGEPLDPRSWVIREAEAPVGRKAARLFVIKSMSVKDWQGFAEVFGIPAIFAIMPDGIQDGDVSKFQAIAEQIISEARGALPPGSDIKTVEAKNTGNSPFKELAEWCDSQLVIASTGGLLTMLTAPGSGTLAGSAHQEAFELLAKREAVIVTEIMQEQVDRPLLEDLFPGQPVLAYWQLSPVVEHDPAAVIDHAVKLKSAGYSIKTEQLQERCGYELEEVAEPEPEPEAEAEEDQQEEDGEQEPEPEPDEDDPLKNRADDQPEPAADPQDAARRSVASALNDDFEGCRGVVERLMTLDPASPEYLAGLMEWQRMVQLLAGADPGSLKADTAFADLAAESLLEGWSQNPDNQ